MKLIGMSDKVILAELGQRIHRERLNRNTTQVELSRRAGVARAVVQHLENGHGCALEGLIRILRTLGLLDQLDAFLPDPGLSPVQLAKFHSKQRQRASGRRGGKITGAE